MGIFERLFGRKPITGGDSAYQTLTAYKPAFRTWSGQMYESELIRAVVDAFARHVSKLRVEFVGSARPSLKTAMKAAPNEWQTWPQFLYRLATIYEICNTAFIVPVLDDYGRTSGYYPVLPTCCELIDIAGVPYLRYTFNNGKKAAIELSRCGVMTKHQYKDDIFGESNSALNSTLQLLDMQAQGIQEGIKNSATFRFMAKLTNFSAPKDLAKTRQEFNAENLRGENGGILLFPNTFNDIRQIESKPYVVDDKQMHLIQTNVYNYFGSNEKILQNSAMGDELDAYFDGKIEPFSMLLSDAMTGMTYSPREISTNNHVIATANRLQYMNTANKINLAQQMGDRGILTINEIRELFNYPPIEEGGDYRPARGEYNNSLGLNEPEENKNDE